MLETELTPNSKTWNSGVESPEVIENPSVYHWSDEADLIVIGLGGAGVSAANEALDQNLSVIAIDKTTGGGATARSGGVFYAGGGTPIQKEANISDSPDNMYRYLKQEVGNVVKDETLRKFCDTSPANTQWLMDMESNSIQATIKPRLVIQMQDIIYIIQIIHLFPNTWRLQNLLLEDIEVGKKVHLNPLELVEPYITL